MDEQFFWKKQLRNISSFVLHVPAQNGNRIRFNCSEWNFVFWFLTQMVHQRMKPWIYLFSQITDYLQYVLYKFVLEFYHCSEDNLKKNSLQRSIGSCTTD